MRIAEYSVLLVEDEFLIALDAEQILQDMGAARVEIISNLKEAMARAREGRFDLGLLDVNINGERSFQVAELLKSRGIPFVFATGYGMQDRPLAGFDGGICVSKPYTAERLEKAIETALTGAPQKHAAG